MKRGYTMEKFVMKKSAEANIYKSIRFPIELNSQIIEIIERANKGLDKKRIFFQRVCCFCL